MDWPIFREFHYWLLDQYFINFNAISTSIRIHSICFISSNQNVSDSGCYSFCHSFSEWNLCSESLLCVSQIERTQRDNGPKMHLLMHKGNEIPLKCIENQINASLCKELQWKNNGQRSEDWVSVDEFIPFHPSIHLLIYCQSFWLFVWNLIRTYNTLTVRLVSPLLNGDASK